MSVEVSILAALKIFAVDAVSPNKLRRRVSEDMGNY
jgi:hypothetical protein